MSSLVFGVATSDPLTFAALPVMIIGVTALACYVPARRASRIDPVLAIKQD
jgi:ABC-type lipoprotein release transport system permease subunit